MESVESETAAGVPLLRQRDTPLEYHHREPSNRSFSLGGHPERQWNPDEVAREMSKCDLCCHQCHVRVHRAANAAYQLANGEAELRGLLRKDFRPIHVDAALTLLRDMKKEPGARRTTVAKVRTSILKPMIFCTAVRTRVPAAKDWVVRGSTWLETRCSESEQPGRPEDRRALVVRRQAS